VNEGLGMFLKGAVLGFSIAAPVGPIGVLCIRRTLADGWSSGIATGMGAALADGVYGAIAAFGLTAISGALVSQQMWIRLIGGAFMLWLGVRTFLSPPADRAAAVSGSGLLGAFASTFVLTLTNPMTILSFVAIFAALGLAAGAATPTLAGLLVIGVVFGSLTWTTILTTSVGAFRGHFDAPRLRWVNRFSGVIIAGFGLLAIASLLRPGAERA
jgi:threonine/homoserine/homoserine lactone efflux protein